MLALLLAAGMTLILSAGASAEGDGMCHRPDAVAVGDLWIDDRPDEGSPNGLVGGGGTWLYQESNGVPGLQVGGTQHSLLDEADGDYVDCENADTLVF